MKAKPMRWGIAVMLAAPLAMAQDPARVGPDIYRCTFENERTRVCEVTFKPGAKMGSHSHPEHLVYVLQGGTMRITNDATGAATESDFTEGQTVWMPAETHRGQNVGKTEIKALVIEFKEQDDTWPPSSAAQQ